MCGFLVRMTRSRIPLSVVLANVWRFCCIEIVKVLAEQVTGRPCEQQRCHAAVEHAELVVTVVPKEIPPARVSGQVMVQALGCCIAAWNRSARGIFVTPSRSGGSIESAHPRLGVSVPQLHAIIGGRIVD